MDNGLCHNIMAKMVCDSDENALSLAHCQAQPYSLALSTKIVVTFDGLYKASSTLLVYLLHAS